MLLGIIIFIYKENEKMSSALFFGDNNTRINLNQVKSEAA